MTGEHNKPVVVLCGFMGTGKTVVGRALAQRLDVEFIDTDSVIEEREGLRVAEIFDKHGEARFRELEAETCRALDPGAGAVIATGGGLMTDPRNAVHLQSLGTTVLLEASVDTIIARAGSAGDRPLLGAEHTDGATSVRGRVESLLESRRSAYEQCELRLDTTTRTPEESACDIHDMLTAKASRKTLVPLRVDTRPIPGQQPGPSNTRVSRVLVGAGAAADLGDWLERLHLTTEVFFLTPAHIEEIALPQITPSLDRHAIPWQTIHIDDGDDHKSMDQVSRLLDGLAAAGAARDSVIVTVGGGVTGDIGGFVSSIYMRGLPFVQIPTSLLAQVDASIGGKVGVNHPRAKNLIGAVYQPHLVLIDSGLLDTLPGVELANGMAEVIKTAIIGSPDLFERLALDTGATTDRPSEAFLEDIVGECARIKASVVERDPYEQDLRRVLNLGHTLGHALESALAYTGIKHGQAVGLGILAAWRVAVNRRAADARWIEETRALLEHFGLPTVVPDVDDAAIRSAMGLDKKRRSGKLTFVLPIEPGQVAIVNDVSDDELIEAMRDEKRKETP